ncbi:hypothetical protein Back2_16870 [Nocardioides baekrokdamisoli]|uniref:Secreted protein n=1 Tax=Nocardioides baekrokdamisoli TaxID=1804624 RepID=A0A3G9IEI7_9ACTN|nr:hypothetical protein [Nocardioides baekrokdamisoli]BBH17400.1 hypothetical protein Back2_16870 [Nocardioides baekrokdamisoli]
MSGASTVRIRAGLVALIALICALLPTVSGRAHAAGTTDPLTITIDAMTPSTSSGDIRLSGHITNADDQTWTQIQVLPFLAPTPIQTTDALAAAMQMPEDAPVGKRILSVFTTIKQLDPGQTTTWSLTVPSSVLPHVHGGVYWFGVHALGTSSAGVSQTADGRARTFLPVVGPTTQKARVHLIVEITEPIEYDATGHLLETTSYAPGAPTWVSEFSGHLARLLKVVNSTPGADLLVDPAVVDAASRLADGNPGWLGDAGALADTKAAAQSWLASFKYVARTHQVWGLPYGDVDITATADRPDIAASAESIAMAPFTAIGVHAAPARRSADLTASGAAVLGPEGSTAFVDARVAGSQSSANGVRVVGTALASLGAPKPGEAYAPVPLRQQILAEAALHLGTTAPVVVVIPSTFSPADPAGFAASLAAPWVSLDTLPQALNGLTMGTFPDQPKAAAESPLVHLSVAAYVAAIRTAATLHNLTGLDVNGPVSRTVLPAMSRAMVHGPSAQSVSVQLADLISNNITVTAPRGVTLSGSSGRFSLALENKLAVPITVSLKAWTDQDTSIGHFGNVPLPAHGAAAPLANVSINAHGNHRVHFSVTDSAGHPIGVTVDVAVRSVQVSGLIWAFIAGGLALLGIAISMRLVRRIRSRA